jgi:hypothetical protein
LRGRAGVGKTLICRIVKSNYPDINVVENVVRFDLIKPSICTSNNLTLSSSIFDKIIDVIPLSRPKMLKALADMLYGKVQLRRSLYTGLQIFYPNINKILTYCMYED